MVFTINWFKKFLLYVCSFDFEKLIGMEEDLSLRVSSASSPGPL
jgi:hypothetical protein